MQLLRLIHAYVGLAVGVILALYAITGGALLFKDEIWRMQYPELKAELHAAAPSEHAAAFRQALKNFPDGVNAIKVPRDGVSAYHVYTDDGEALLNAHDYSMIYQWRWNQTLTGVLSEVHFHLVAADAGKKVGGVVALASALLALAGVVLWWPTRRSFRLRRVPAQSLRRGELLRMHRDFGILSAVSVVLFSATAAGVIFYPQASAILNGLFSERAPDALTVTAAANIPEPGAPTEDQVTVAMAALPQARLIAYYPPSDSRALHYFRFRHLDEPHPNGRSAVYLRPGENFVAQVIDASQAPAGERAAQFLYPLHAAMIGGKAYTAFAIASAVAIGVIALSGPLAYLRRRSRRSGS